MKALRELLPIGLCILACGLAGNGLYGTLGQPVSAPILLIRSSFLFLLLIFAWTLYKLRSRQYGAHWTLWCGVFLAGIFAGAAADSWQTWLESLADRQRKGIAGALLYSFVFFVILTWVEKAFRKIPPRSLVDVRSAPPERRAHLVLFLSEIHDLSSYPEGIPDWLTGTERNLADDLAKLANEKRNATHEGKWPRLWPWEQPLRAIYHHLNGRILKSATLIASRESIRQAPQFAALLAKYTELKGIDFKLFVNAPTPEPQFFDLAAQTTASDGFNFEDFTELSQALHNLLFLLTQGQGKHTHNLMESDIMIDFTGGKKVTSVVAAAMTFNRAVRAQYVQTEDPWDVLSYSVITAQRPI